MFDVAWNNFALPELWLKNGVFDQISGCSGHFDVSLEKWAPVAIPVERPGSGDLGSPDFRV